MNIEQARTNMVKQQCRAWGVLDENILALFQHVPREDFVPKRYQDLAFADMAIPLGHGQSMLAPKEEARILNALKINPNDRVLEVGTGSGFFTMLLASQAKHVDSVDIFEDFVVLAGQKLQHHNIHNIELQAADASLGYKKNTHYDVIVITGSLPILPKPFLGQLNNHGRLFAFLGKAPAMQATLITKLDEHNIQTQILFETTVAPLMSAHAPSEFVF